MNAYKSKNKILATLTAILLFASILLVAVPQANAITVADVKVAGVPQGNTGVTGSPGDRIYVSGTDATPGGKVTLYWNSMIESNKIGEVQLSGTSPNYNISALVPEARVGNYLLIVVDEASVYLTNGIYSLPFTIVPKLTLSSNSGLKGDVIEVTGRGFGYNTAGNANVTLAFSTVSASDFVVSPSRIRPNANGTFTASFTVPNVVDGNYAITATGDATTSPSGLLNSATVQFRVGESIRLSTHSGPTGTQVRVEGRGFTAPTATIPSTVSIFMETATDSIQVFANAAVNAAGTFVATFTVPQIAESALGDWTVKADASDFREASATFRVNGIPSVTTNPVSGSPYTSDVITVTGRNFTAIAGTNITITLDGYPVTTTRTASDGSFTATFTVPQIDTKSYTLEAKEDNKINNGLNNGLVATVKFGIAATSVAVLPSSTNLAAGAPMTIRGFGFGTLGTDYRANITIGDLLVARNVGHTIVDGGFNTVVPSLAAGTYDVKIVTDSGLSAKTTMTITKATTVVLDPALTTRGSTVNITGSNFRAIAGSATVSILNATNRELINAISVAINASGAIVDGQYTVPKDFKLGDYIINVTDSYGLTAETKLTVAKLDVSIELGGTSYMPGNIASFQLVSLMKPTGKVSIYNADGFRFTELEIESSKWVRASDGKYVYQQSNVGGVPAGLLVQLPSDAKLGTWRWNATFNDADEPQIFTGTFSVVSTSPTPTPTPTPTQPPATQPPATQAPPTATPKEGMSGQTKIIIVVAVVALIIGVIAVFLFYTMRRKIAN